MTDQIDLFGNVAPVQASMPAPYREVGMRDTETPGCGDCKHVVEPTEKDHHRWIWRCKILRREVDADNGTCGRWVLF